MCPCRECRLQPLLVDREAAVPKDVQQVACQPPVKERVIRHVPVVAEALIAGRRADAGVVGLGQPVEVGLDGVEEGWQDVVASQVRREASAVLQCVSDEGVRRRIVVGGKPSEDAGYELQRLDVELRGRDLAEQEGQ